MRPIPTASLAAAALLAACSGDADTDNDGTVSGDEIVAEAAGAVQPEPGQYRTSFEMLEFNVPGLPDSVKQQMQAQMGGAAGQGTTTTYCLTPEQAEANGATSHVVMDGQMTSTSSTMTMTNETDMAGMGKMQMKMRAKSERIGDCPA